MRKLLIILASGILLSLITVITFVYADSNSTVTAPSHQAVKALFLVRCNKHGSGFELYCKCTADQMDKHIDDTALSKCGKNSDNQDCLTQVFVTAMNKVQGDAVQCQKFLPGMSGNAATVPTPAPSGAPTP
jgi:hypothetical protein